MAQTGKCFYKRVGNILGKGENAGYQHFLLSNNVYRASFLASLKIGMCGNRLTARLKQEGHDGPEIAHLSLLTKHAPSSFPVT